MLNTPPGGTETLNLRDIRLSHNREGDCGGDPSGCFFAAGANRLPEIAYCW
jgi:hypothetical protein